MLSIHFGDVIHEVYHPSTYFNNQYEDFWITDPFTKEMVKDVDQSDVLEARIIDSPVLGPITPRELSGGVKTLILLKFDDTGRIFNGSACGNNCAKWILKIAEDKDITIALHNIMDFGDGPYTIKILNSGITVHNRREYVDQAIRFYRSDDPTLNR